MPALIGNVTSIPGYVCAGCTASSADLEPALPAITVAPSSLTTTLAGLTTSTPGISLTGSVQAPQIQYSPITQGVNAVITNPSPIAASTTSAPANVSASYGTLASVPGLTLPNTGTLGSITSGIIGVGSGAAGGTYNTPSAAYGSLTCRQSTNGVMICDNPNYSSLGINGIGIPGVYEGASAGYGPLSGQGSNGITQGYAVNSGALYASGLGVTMIGAGTSPTAPASSGFLGSLTTLQKAGVIVLGVIALLAAMYLIREV